MKFIRSLYYMAHMLFQTVIHCFKASLAPTNAQDGLAALIFVFMCDLNTECFTWNQYHLQGVGLAVHVLVL